jgi:adenylosuccinate lyase
MKKNINLTKGLVFSQRVLLALTRKGLSREEAYQLVQRNSLKAWEESKDFKKLVENDPDIYDILSRQDIDGCFTFDPYLSQIDYIFDRVLTDEKS